MEDGGDVTMRLRKKHCFEVFLVCFLISLFSADALGDAYQDMIANSLHMVECPYSRNEVQPFDAVPFSPYDFLQIARDHAEQLNWVFKENGLNTDGLPSISTESPKLFTFWGIPVSDTPCDLVVLCYGDAPANFAVVFLNINGEWMLTDVIPDVESVETMCGLTNTWLKIHTSAFSDGVQIERLYSLSARKHELCYVSRDASPAYDLGPDDVVFLSAYSMISEYSTVVGSESVYACELYIVRNTSLCTMQDEDILEHHASTEIDLYTYDYEEDRFIYLQTNQYNGVGAATINSLLRKDLLVSNTQVVIP